MNNANSVPTRRRQALGAVSAFTALALAACGGGGSSGSSPSSNAALAGLSLSAAGLSPAFDPTVTAYTLAVANSVATLTVMPTLADTGASVKVNGSVVASGTGSSAIALAAGSNTVSVVATAADGSTRTYTVVVTRAAASVSTDASLSSLVFSAGALSPTFSSGTTSYTAAVANAVSAVTVTPTASGTAATLRVNNVVVSSGSVSGSIALAVGSNTLTVLVTAEDGSTTSTTTITVARAAAALSSDASLAGLVLSQGSLSPSFATATTSYSVAVANTVTALIVTPTSTSNSATIAVNGSGVGSGSASGSLALAVGSNTVNIVVTAEDGSTARSYTLAVTRSAVGSCTITPTETQGPYPLLAILSNTAMVRSDMTGGKTGVPLTVTLTLLDASSGCAPVSNAAIYIWHCDKDGLYSGYSTSNNAGQTGLTYLRGIQVTDGNGQVTFTTIYPGWYAGRITHIHAQVYLNDNLNVTATATTQLAFPLNVTQAVYNSALYTKGQNTSVTSFAADNVFSDGTTYEMVAISGDTTNGYAASLTITIA